MWINFIFAMVAVCLFSLCARALIVTIRRPIPVYNSGEYSKLALRTRKIYLGAAWGIMTLTFLATMFVSWTNLWLDGFLP